MKHHLHTKGFGVEVDPEQEDDLIKEMHKHKTATFVGLIESGKLPLRPGVKRFMQEAMDSGLILGVCTTSNVKSAHAIAYDILKDIDFEFVLAGDMVSRKKPDPEIYNLALEKTNLKPEEVVVIEDSRNGVLAAKRADLHIVATTNIYTEKEDLSEADIIVTSLGDPGGEQGILKKGDDGLTFDGVLHVEQVVDFFSPLN